jgi:tetratricopeptide (TPR) repeat protein
MVRDEHKGVFISYRRSVASFIARAVFQDLRQHDYDVFMDVESIDNGVFDNIILRQIEARPHFIVILTQGSLERCADPNDWMRREIECAIEKRRNIVPLLVNDFDFKAAKPSLTGKLAELGRYNGVPVPHDFFEEAMQRLRSRFLKKPASGAIKPTPAADQPAVQHTIERVTAQSAPTDRELDAEVSFHRGLARDKMDFKGKVEDYTEAIRLNPNYTDAYKNRATARYNLGDYEGALADYDEALRLNPHYAEVCYGRGMARKAIGNLPGALADFNAALRLKPLYPDAYNSRGLLHSERGDYDTAIADFDQAVQLNPTYADAYRNRGMASEARGDDTKAIADYHTYLLLDGGKRYSTYAKIQQRIQTLQKRRSVREA